MTTLTLNNGTTIPQLGLGTWRAEPGKVAAAVTSAVLESGYRHIDCASIYRNQVEIGQAFSDILASGEVKRADLFVTSKLWNADHHPDNVEKACRQTLAELQLDYLDLYLVHWGVAFAPNQGTHPIGDDGVVKTEPVPLYQTWAAMEKLVETGLVKAIGVSNYTVPMVVDLLAYAKIKPVMNQVEIHAYLSQPELVDFCHTKEVVVTAYSPLGRPGNLRADQPSLIDDKVVVGIAAAHKKTPAQVLLRWLLQRQIVVIPKSVTPDRIAENAALFDFDLTKQEMSQLNDLNRNLRLVNPLDWGLAYFN